MFSKFIASHFSPSVPKGIIFREFSRRIKIRYGKQFQNNRQEHFLKLEKITLRHQLDNNGNHKEKSQSQSEKKGNHLVKIISNHQSDQNGSHKEKSQGQNHFTEFQKLVMTLGAIFGALKGFLEYWESYQKSTVLLSLMKTNYEPAEVAALLNHIHFFNMNTADEQGYTVLHYAAERGDASLVGKFLAKGAKIDVYDKNNETPLYKALFNNNPDIVDILLDGASSQVIEKIINQKNAQGNTPLMAAAYGGDYRIFEKLLFLGADIDPINHFGETVLHFSVKYKKEDIAKRLIYGLADKEKIKFIDCKNYHGQEINPPTNFRTDFFPEYNNFLFISSIFFPSQKTLLLIDDEKKWINRLDNDNNSVFFLAIQHELSEPFLKMLLDFGVDINQNIQKQQSIGNSPKVNNVNSSDEIKTLPKQSLLNYLVGNGKNFIFKEILKHKELDIQKKDVYGRTPYDIIAALTSGKNELEFPNYFEILNILRERLNNDREKIKKIVFTALYDKDHKFDFKLMTDYIQCGGNLADTNEKRDSLLDLFIRKGDFLMQDNNGNNIFHLLARFDDPESYQKLKKAIPFQLFQKMINEKNTINGVSPIYEASFFGSLKLVKMFASDGVALDQVSKYDWSPLAIASWAGHIKMTKLLIDLFKKRQRQEEKNRFTMYKFMNQPNQNNETPLWWALNIQDVVPKEAEKYKEEHLNLVKLLLEEGADPNISSADGTTPLHIASMYGLNKIAEILLSNNQKYSVLLEPVAGRYKERPLHYAAIYNQYEMVKILVDSHADVNARNIGGRTAYDLTSSKKIEAFLLKNSLNKNNISQASTFKMK